MPSSDDEEVEDVAADAFTPVNDSGLRFVFRLLVQPDKASTTAGQNRYEASKVGSLWHCAQGPC